MSYRPLAQCRVEVVVEEVVVVGVRVNFDRFSVVAPVAVEVGRARRRRQSGGATRDASRNAARPRRDAAAGAARPTAADVACVCVSLASAPPRRRSNSFFKSSA